MQLMPIRALLQQNMPESTLEDSQEDVQADHERVLIPAVAKHKQVYYGHVSLNTMTCWVDLIKETMRSVPDAAQAHHLVKQGALYGRQ